MDMVTEQTCPECGEQQANVEECLSCGANLPSPAEDIPTMQGKKTVSAAWPTESSAKTTSPEALSKAKPVQNDSPKKESASQSTWANIDSEVTKKSKAPNKPSTSTDWELAGAGEDDEQNIISSETSPQEVDLPWHAISNSQDMDISETSSTIEQASAIDPSDSGNPEHQSDDVPPTPVPLPQEAFSSPHHVRHPLFWGTGRSLFGIFIVNTFLTLITFGVYSFWGRARVRDFLNSQTSFANARFAYHGTGKELLTGWLKAMLVFGVPYLFLSALPYFWQGVPLYVTQGIAGLLILCFIPVAVVGAHRYRLSRTSLRNIRFSFRGTVSDYTKLWLKGSVLSVLTLGIYYPFFENTRRQYLVSHSQFGNQTFAYDGTGTGLLTIYSKATGLYIATLLFLACTTLALVTTYLSMPLSDMNTIIFTSSALPIIIISGLIVPWFYLQAARQRFFWNHTQFGDARFSSAVTAWKMFELRLGHLVLLLSTLGLAWPWVQVRNLQFFYYYTGLNGSINLNRVEQDALDASPTGEELAGFFDTGFDLG